MGVGLLAVDEEVDLLVLVGPASLFQLVRDYVAMALYLAVCGIAGFQIRLHYSCPGDYLQQLA